MKYDTFHRQVQLTEKAWQLHETLLDTKDKLAEMEDELSRCREALEKARQELDSRPVLALDASPSDKDAALARLDRERRELEIIVAAGADDAAVRRARRAADREWASKVEALEGALDMQRSIEADALAALATERKVHASRHWLTAVF